MKFSAYFVLGTLFAFTPCLFCNTLISADWENWRGPTWSGNAPGELPTHWDSIEGVLWKTELPPWGNSTPIVVGDSIFLTTHENEDRLVLLRLNKTDGKIVWSKKIAAGLTTPRHVDGKEFRDWHKFNNYHNLASPSVVADSETIIAHFGTGDLAAFDWNGNLLWKTNMQGEFGNFVIWWGHANTPLLYENLVIVPVMQDNLSDLPEKTPVDSYIVAFEKTTGKQAWKVIRNMKSNQEYSDAYTSPMLWKHEGRTELLVLGSETLDAYNPKTGERYWWLNKGLEGNRIVPSPVPCESLGLVFAVRGMREPVCCIAPKGLGEQSESALIWSHKKNSPDVSCPVLCNGFLFFTSDQGIATCVDAQTGDVQWEKRLPVGTYFPSLLADGKHVFYMNNDGLCTIVKADKEFVQVAQNKLEGTFLSSLVAADGKLFIRGREAIYCIGK